MSCPYCHGSAYGRMAHSNPVAVDCDGAFRRMPANTYITGGYCGFRVMPPTLRFIFVKMFLINRKNTVPGVDSDLSCFRCPTVTCMSPKIAHLPSVHMLPLSHLNCCGRTSFTPRPSRPFPCPFRRGRPSHHSTYAFPLLLPFAVVFLRTIPHMPSPIHLSVAVGPRTIPPTHPPSFPILIPSFRGSFSNLIVVRYPRDTAEGIAQRSTAGP